MLLAPSWGESGIFAKCGRPLIEEILKAGFQLIIRPHPQSLISETERIDTLRQAFPDSGQVSWDTADDNFASLSAADILISDFSGVIFDFALVFDKPVLYTDTGFDKAPYDCWWLPEELWTFRILPKIGRELKASDIPGVGGMIRKALHDPDLAAGRAQAREETWMHRGEGAARAADYLQEKLRQV